MVAAVASKKIFWLLDSICSLFCIDDASWHASVNNDNKAVIQGPKMIHTNEQAVRIL